MSAEYQCQVIPPNVPQAGLVAWYPFNGNANDESVNNNNGVVSGALLTTDRFGNSNSAYYFNGQGDMIDVFTPNSFVFDATNSFTINVWFRPDSVNGNLSHNNSQIIFQKYSCPYGVQMDHIDIRFSDKAEIRNRGMAGHDTISAEVDICRGWQMVTYVKKANIDTLELYINGERKERGHIFSNAHNTSVPYRFGSGRRCASGSANLTPVRSYKGKIDDAGIWDRALTETEIAALYDYSYSLEIDLSPDITSLCSGDSILIYHNDTSDNPNLSWEIITPSNTIIQSDADTILLPNLTFGNYTVFLKTHDSICADTVFALDSISCNCLVGDYQFLGNADDLSGNNNDGIPFGVTQVAGQSGQPNTAYRFTGSNNSYIELNNNQPVIQNDEFTIISVARKLGPGGGVDGRQALFSQRHDAVGGSTLSKINFFIEVPGDLIRCNLRKSTTGSDDLVTFPAPMDTNWHCYAVTLDSLDSLKLYLDGSQVSSVQINQTGDFTTSIDYTQIGRHSYGGDPHRSYFNGDIDFVEIYNCYVDPTQACAMVKCEGFDFALTVDSLSSAGCDSFLVSVDSVLFGTSPLIYDWSTGDSTQQVLFTPGVYSVTVSDSLGCSKADTFEIKAKSINLDIDSASFCLFDSILVRTTDTAGALIKSWSVSTPDSVFNFQGDTLPL